MHGVGAAIDEVPIGASLFGEMTRGRDSLDAHAPPRPDDVQCERRAGSAGREHGLVVRCASSVSSPRPRRSALGVPVRRCRGGRTLERADARRRSAEEPHACVVRPARSRSCARRSRPAARRRGRGRARRPWHSGTDTRSQMSRRTGSRRSFLRSGSGSRWSCLDERTSSSGRLAGSTNTVHTLECLEAAHSHEKNAASIRFSATGRRALRRVSVDFRGLRLLQFTCLMHPRTTSTFASAVPSRTASHDAGQRMMRFGCFGSS